MQGSMHKYHSFPISHPPQSCRWHEFTLDLHLFLISWGSCHMYITSSPLFPHNPTLSAPERISTDTLRARSLDLNPKNPEKPMGFYFVVPSVCLQYVINCVRRLEIRYIDDIWLGGQFHCQNAPSRFKLTVVNLRTGGICEFVVRDVSFRMFQVTRFRYGSFDDDLETSPGGCECWGWPLHVQIIFARKELYITTVI